MNKKKQLKIVYSKWGLGSNFGNYIEISNSLKNDKKLRDYVVKHELGHIQGFDLAHEFNIDWKIMPFLMLFVAKNPRTWIDFLPIQYRKGTIIYDFNLILLYTLAIIVCLGAFKVARIL